MLQGHYNDPSRTTSPHPQSYYFYGIGGSAYMDPKTPGTPDETLSNLPDASVWSKAIQNDTDYAAAFGLRRIAYEGGPSLEGGTITDANRPAIRDDPRMKDAMVAAHDLWSANGGDLLVYFTAVGESPWGFVPDVWDAANAAKNQKLQAIDALDTRSRAKLTYGTVLPATLDATKYNVPPSYVFNPQPTTPGEWFGYTVRADDAASFKIALSVKSADANGKLDVLVDGKLIGTLDAPNTGSGNAQDTGTLTVALEAGLHGIIVRGETGSVSLEQVKVSP
jgi:Carbohydrate binding module (family 6)